MLVRILMFVALAVLVRVVFKLLAGPPKVFTARVDPDGVNIRGMVPTMNNSDAADYIREQALPMGTKIVAIGDPQRGMRLQFKGGPVPGDKQREIERFLTTSQY